MIRGCMALHIYLPECFTHLYIQRQFSIIGIKSDKNQAIVIFYCNLYTNTLNVPATALRLLGCVSATLK